MAESKETKLRKAAEARGWTLVKDGKTFRLVDARGTVMAADWATGGGLSLDAIAEAVE